MIIEHPVIRYVDIEIQKPVAGFILGRSILGIDKLKDAGEVVQWVSYLGVATNVSIQRGGKRENVTFTNDVGTLSMTVLNAANPFDNPDIQPRQPIRVRSRDTGALIFSGSLLNISTSHKFDKVGGRLEVTTFVSLNAVDAVQAHGNVIRYGAQEHPQSAWARIDTLARTATTPVAVPAPDPALPYLTGTVYEGPLSKHFDMVANTIGGIWYVDTEGVTRFRYGTAGTPVAVFSDQPGHLSYTDIETGYGSDRVVNTFTLKNHGIQTNEEGEIVASDSDFSATNYQSISQWGAQSESVDTTFYSYADIDARLDDVLGYYANPQRFITRIVWNAQENTSVVPLLELGALVQVTLGNTTQALRITNIRHDMSPTRWLITLDLGDNA